MDFNRPTFIRCAAVRGGGNTSIVNVHHIIAIVPMEGAYRVVTPAGDFWASSDVVSSLSNASLIYGR